MVEFDAVVRKRRMVRHFTDEPVPMAVLERLIDLALHAPSAGFSQGVRYLLVTERAIRQRIAEIAGEAWYVSTGHHPFISEAPAQIVLCTSEAAYRERYDQPDKVKPDASHERWPVPFWHTDAGAALMLLLLAATDAGLASAFVRVREPSLLNEALGIPGDVLPVGVVLVGHGAEDKRSGSLARGRQPIESVLHRERWSG